MKKNKLVHKKSKMLFVWAEDTKSYEPIGYDMRTNEDTGEIEFTEITKGTIFYDFIMYIRYSSMITDKKTGKKTLGSFEIYQWDIAFKIIKEAMELKSTKSMTAISRQAGKTYSARKIIAFLIIFLPNFVFIPEDRYYAALCSPTTKLIEDHMRKLQIDIDSAVDLFNKLYHNSKIITPQEDKTLLNRLTNKEYDRMLNGEQIHYSQIVGLSLEKSVINAGFSFHLLFLDEAQEINYEQFNEQLQPTVARTGGITYALGTTLPDSTNVLFNFFKNITIPEERKIRYDWESVYACKKAVNESSAEKYRNSVENEIKQHGKKSQYIQTQYYCSFIVKGERFIMKEDLEDNGVFGTDYEENINHYRKNKLFRVGGYDPATSDDNAALSLGLTQQVDDNNFAVILKGCKILNKEERKYSSEELAKQVALECKINQIDMLMIDATNAQEDRAYMVYKELKNIGCNTLVVPYSYANTNKQKMVQHVEDMIFAGQLKIPYEYYQDEYPDYKEFLDELFYLQRKISSTGTITYKAPDGSSFHDDLPMSFFQMAYVAYYVHKKSKEQKKVDLGGGITYYLRLHKNNSEANNLNTFSKGNKKNRASYYYTGW